MSADKILGVQYIVEFTGCNEKVLDNTEQIEAFMNEAAKKANATIVQSFFHHYNPIGVSGTVVIAESHINIHTWPEHQYAAVDIFSCGTTLKAEEAVSYLKSALEAEAHSMEIIKRGIFTSTKVSV